ncbi:putative ribosome biogenesis protein C8F11.04 [Grifola frondosa]|uniref:Ribosomal L1 domain-containing protein 1 n=1 Tax=Grifola frondosa TaxID=5627 RepID=A0A1C7M506_GRIFR|nr:putative ribosome biogenesis protein C8F11.04 [Grifola frondosa]
MSKGKLIDEHVSVHQCKLAVNALLGHALKVEEKKSENQLLSGKEQNVWLVVTQKQMHPEKKLKPAKMCTSRSSYRGPSHLPVCLITKDPQREYKDLLESHNIKFISRVVGIAKLKGKFKPFEARRILLKENGLFLADERVIPLLPGLLGKKFFEAKKQPIPVCLTRKDLKGELERAISSTYFHQNQGTCTSIKIGVLSQKPAQVLANLETALPAVVKHVNGEWDNVQSLHIKTNSSASLPIWSCNLGEAEGARWDGLAAGASSDEESAAESGEDSEMEVDEKPQPAKGKKRAAQDDEEKPKKKAKAEPTAEGEAGTPMKAKFEATIKESAPSKAKAIVSAAADVLAKRLKKRKAAAADAEGAGQAPASPSISVVPVASTELPTDEHSKKSRRKPRTTTDNTLALAPAPATAPEPSPPATPSVSSQKPARTSAVDFFEDSEAHPAPVPPNTPANALATQTPKLSKRTKNVNTPVSAAIAKLAAAPEPVVSTVEQTDVPAAGTGTDGLTTRVKKPRHKKQKAAIVSAADDESVPAPKEPIPEPSAEAAEGVPAAKKTKRKKQKSSNDDVPPVDATSAKEPAAEPVVEAAEAAPETKKVKRRKQKAAEPLREEATAPAASADGADGSTLTKEEVEKKKDKLVNSKPASKSAKDAVVGKRKL